MAGKSGLVSTSTNYTTTTHYYTTTINYKYYKLLVLVSTNPDFPAIQPRRDASKSYIRFIFLFVSMYTLPDSIKSSVVAKKISV